jgi:transcriptional regulator with XRE-family HTH domain
LKRITYLPINVSIARQTQYPPCETLRRIRIEKGLTQSDLSVLVIQHGHKITNQYISRFESGHDKPWPAARRAIASVLEMSEIELFPENNKTSLD